METTKPSVQSPSISKHSFTAHVTMMQVGPQDDGDDLCNPIERCKSDVVASPYLLYHAFQQPSRGKGTFSSS